MSPEEPSSAPDRPSENVQPQTPTEPPMNTPALVPIEPSDSSVLSPSELTEPQTPPFEMNQPPISSKQARKRNMLVGVALAVLVAFGATAWYWQNQKANPETVFTAALAQLLSTKTITQATESDSTSGVLAYDGSDVKNPKISINVSLKVGSLTNKMSGYSTLSNSYLKYTSFGSDQIDSKVPSLVNKWVQLRQNGTVLKGVDAQSENIVDPRTLAFGDLLIGNFSAHDRQNLMNYISANKIYTYDSSKVTTATVGGNAVYVYSLTENIPKLKQLNIKAAAIMGIPEADIQAALDELGMNGTTKVYVGINNKQIVKYTSTQDGATVTGSYTDYDTTTLPIEPKADMTWDEFMQKQADVLNALATGAGASLSSPVNGAPVTDRVD